MKSKITTILLALIFPILFNVLFFVIGGFEHPVSVWISYGWIHFAYIMLGITPLLSDKTRSAYIFTSVNELISGIYFVAELIIGLIFIFIGTENVKVTVIIQIIPLFIYLFVLLFMVLMNNKTANNERRQTNEVNFIKDSASRIKSIMMQVTDAQLSKALERTHDLIANSPTRSCANATSTEGKIVNLICRLEALNSTGDYASMGNVLVEMQVSINERNRLVQMNNY